MGHLLMICQFCKRKNLPLSAFAHKIEYLCPDHPITVVFTQHLISLHPPTLTNSNKLYVGYHFILDNPNGYHKMTFRPGDSWENKFILTHVDHGPEKVLIALKHRPNITPENAFQYLNKFQNLMVFS